jgi:hypothetical protein
MAISDPVYLMGHGMLKDALVRPEKHVSWLVGLKEISPLQRPPFPGMRYDAQRIDS